MKKTVVALVSVALISCVTGGAGKGSSEGSSGQRSDRLPSSKAEGPRLTVRSGNQIRTFSAGDLISSAHVTKIAVEQDPTYSGRRMEYMAVPVADLFAGLSIDEDSTILFTCADGFSAPMSPARLLNTDPGAAISYIAIETPNEKWPPLKAEGTATAGPFYLVWQGPERSNISSEEWPFQLVGFEVKPSIESQFPHTVPNLNAKNAIQIKEGYRLFLKNCFVCHTVNGEGMSQVGPDLNIPFNPTEYWKAGYIAKQIRDPQSLRRWPQAKMKGFATSALSDNEVAAIVSYLKQMATQKYRR